MSEQDGKPWWTSRTIWSAVAVLIVALLQVFGVAVTDQDAAEMAQVMGDIAIALFAVLAIWSRVVATKRIEPAAGPQR